ncbi:MAG: hypothetical protein GY849_05920 [Deltaproteobacteria bacterium]|nr:hypothetical protein [Deltaproteobacteria bacterium]
MTKKSDEKEGVFCPVGRFFMDLEEGFGKDSKFFEHLTRSRVEFLKAFRSLADATIERLEKQKGASKSKKKATKIKVE